MGRSRMPPLSLWLKGSETEPDAKSVPTSSHRMQFIHSSAITIRGNHEIEGQAQGQFEPKIYD